MRDAACSAEDLVVAVIVDDGEGMELGARRDSPRQCTRRRSVPIPSAPDEWLVRVVDVA